jgi:hypothetical protein
MKYLLNKPPIEIIPSDKVGGQLLAPPEYHANWQGAFGTLAGAFEQFNAEKFRAWLFRDKTNRLICKFLSMPHIVDNPKRTMEIFTYWRSFIPNELIPDEWPRALVVQPHSEFCDIPWGDLKAIVLDGTNAWMDGNEAMDLVRTALILKKHVHVRNVNTVERFHAYDSIGAQTCDGMIP